MISRAFKENKNTANMIINGSDIETVWIKAVT
jgi:hypothetical protein